MKVYYFLHNLSLEDFKFFRDKVTEIKNTSDVDVVLWKYVHRIWEPYTWRTQRAAFVEACVFITSYLRERNGNISDIEWVYSKNFLAYNDDVYEFSNNNWLKITTPALFVTSRDSWKHPFFLYLLKVWTKNGITVVKPNMNIQITNRDKISYTIKLWKFRKLYLGDVVIPLLMNPSVDRIKSLMGFVWEHMWNQAIIKNNYWVQWKNVQALDVASVMDNPDKLESIKKDFYAHKIYSSQSAFLTNYYDIQKEFRLYYTNTEEGIEIYSVKNRINSTKDWKSIFNQTDYTYNSLNIQWDYLSPKAFKADYKEVHEAARDIIPFLGLDVGVLELCKLQDGGIRFIEVNPLWWTLLHHWEDEKNIKDYYLNMWKKAFS